MQRKALWTIALSLLVLLLALPIAASAQEHVRTFAATRPVVIHSYPYWGWGGWGGPWGDPFWGGYYGPTYYDLRGKIKIKDDNKYDQVFLNGAYAGTVDKMKNMHLDPGRYDVQIKKEGRPVIDRQVYVVSGKTIEIHVNGE